MTDEDPNAADYILLPPIFDESPHDEEAKQCLCVMMEKLKCEEMAEFSAETTATAAVGVAVGFLLFGDHSFEETAQWLEQQAKKVRCNSKLADVWKMLQKLKRSQGTNDDRAPARTAAQ